MDTSNAFYIMCFEAFPDDRGDGTVFKTQGQLQEMVGSYAEQCDCLGGYIDWDAKKQGWTFQFESASMEQLWLAFVMKEKYNKIWDGEKWCDKEGQVGASD